MRILSEVKNRKTKCDDEIVCEPFAKEEKKKEKKGYRAYTHCEGGDGGVYISDIDPNWKERCYLETHTHTGWQCVRHEPINNFPPTTTPSPYMYIFVLSKK